MRDQVRAGVVADTLLLVEHLPVVTIGRSASEEHLLCSKQELLRRGVDLHRVSRGGDVTYHGPGQLVGYPIRTVRRRVRDHVEGIVDALLGVVQEAGIKGWWEKDNPGLWTADGKIAAVGVDARGGVSMHGFALNVTTDLSQFSLIVPCGLRRPVTSMEACGVGRHDVADVGRRVARRLAARWGLIPRIRDTVDA